MKSSLLHWSYPFRDCESFATVTSDCDSDKFCSEKNSIKYWLPELASLSTCFSAQNLQTTNPSLDDHD